MRLLFHILLAIQQGRAISPRDYKLSEVEFERFMELLIKKGYLERINVFPPGRSGGSMDNRYKAAEPGQALIL